LIEEDVIAGDKVIGMRKTLNPAFAGVKVLSDRLAILSREQLLSPQSRTESAGDYAALVRAKRDLAMLEHRRNESSRIDALIARTPRAQLPAKTEGEP
jgi:hypothetical protein